MALTVVCMKWGEKYTPSHVVRLRNMLERHLHMDYRLVCITDSPAGLGVETLPIWEDDSPGCFRRLDLFKPEMRDFLGERFISIDLDCIVMDDVTPIFSRKEDFIIWKSPSGQPHYCGSLFMMDAGARARVADAPRVESKRWIGTDQGVIRETLGPKEATWSEKDGIYNKLEIGRSLPENARIVFYAGPRDPTGDKTDWAREHYR